MLDKETNIVQYCFVIMRYGWVVYMTKKAGQESMEVGKMKKSVYAAACGIMAVFMVGCATVPTLLDKSEEERPEWVVDFHAWKEKNSNQIRFLALKLSALTERNFPQAV